MIIRKKTSCITLNSRSKREELHKPLEPSAICLAEVANSAIFADNENLDLPNTTTPSISPKQKCEMALNNNSKEFH